MTTRHRTVGLALAALLCVSCCPRQERLARVDALIADLEAIDGDIDRLLADDLPPELRQEVLNLRLRVAATMLQAGITGAMPCPDESEISDVAQNVLALQVALIPLTPRLP